MPCCLLNILFDEISVATVCFSMGQADAGGSGIVSRRLTGQQSGADQFVMMIPNNKVWQMLLIGSYNYLAPIVSLQWINFQVGLVIGKGGETIKSMQATTGARIQVG